MRPCLLMGEMPTQFPLPPNCNRRVSNQPSRQLSESASIFRVCHDRFKACLEYQSLRTGSPMNATVANYLLDFDLASKRALGSDHNRYRLFQLHFLEGRAAEEICGELGIGRFTYASEVFQIERLAGQSFLDRGLFPLAEYFGEREGSGQERRAA